MRYFAGMELLGILSALLTLSAFVANQYGWVRNDSIWYDSANLLSGIGLFIYAYSLGSVPFMLTNSVWSLVSGIDVLKYFFGRRPKKRRPRRR